MNMRFMPSPLAFGICRLISTGSGAFTGCPRFGDGFRKAHRITRRLGRQRGQSRLGQAAIQDNETHPLVGFAADKAANACFSRSRARRLSHKQRRARLIFCQLLSWPGFG